MLNRGDLRMLTVIVSTASLSAIATVTVVKLTASDTRTSALEARVAKLEAPPPLPPPPPPLAPLPPLHDVVPDPEPCDEVSCVLDNYEPVCCAHFRKVAESLDRAAITEGVARIRGRVMSCNDMDAKGLVKVSVKVSPDGTVSGALVREAPNQALGVCVVHAMRSASFAPTLNGGSFSYPFVF
jgi:outer membrane biosynthesis protein TonB